jgi:copper oxidase (laccase) domain-containing protein
MFDLPGYLVTRMQSFGVGQVIDSGLCTYRSEDEYYSYRRATHRGEKDYGRQIAVIGLR